jgi:transposase
MGGLHLPLNRQSAVYAREGIDLDVSTLADLVGAAAATLMPPVEAIRGPGSPLSTSMPMTPPCRRWPRARPERPIVDLCARRPAFCGPDPPAAVFFYSRDCGGEHPEQHLAGFAGLMQADAYAGFNRLYEASRNPGRLSRLPAGPIRGASSSIWPGSIRRRLPVRRSSESMSCLPSSARSAA